MSGVKGQRSGGANRKSSVVRLVQGNAGKRPTNKFDNVELIPPQMPPCPEHLDVEARKVWERLAPQLHARGLLTELDVDALGALCSTQAILSEARERLADEGLVVTGPRGAVKPSPWLAIANQAQRDLRSLAAEFGLTPLSRQRITVVPPPAPDPFQELLDQA
jgi:P27 family predicted phage terminase small subunit